LGLPDDWSLDKCRHGIFRKKEIRLLLKVVLPYAAFGIFLFATKQAGHQIDAFYTYLLVIPVIIFADLLSKDNPARQLLLFSILGITALFITMFAEGMIGVFALLSVGDVLQHALALHFYFGHEKSGSTHYARIKFIGHDDHGRSDCKFIPRFFGRRCFRWGAIQLLRRSSLFWLSCLLRRFNVEAVQIGWPLTSAMQNQDPVHLF
jgi:hypothetical protein